MRILGTVIAATGPMSFASPHRCLGYRSRCARGGACTSLAAVPDRPRSVTVRRPLGHHSLRPRQSGFTLLELFAVVIIISIMATLAIPAVTKQMRDRRTRLVAEQIADQYRTARMRALGRGGAVMIQVTAGTASAPGSFEVREAVRGGPATDPMSFMPVSSCTLTAWTLADLQPAGGFTASRRIFRYDVHPGGDQGTVVINTKRATGADVPSLSVCFTPMGRPFLSVDGAASWTPLSNVPLAEVYRSSDDGTVMGMQRVVLLLPNGAARVAGVAVP